MNFLTTRLCPWISVSERKESEEHLFLMSFLKAGMNALYPGIKHFVNFQDKQENKLNELATLI